MPNGCRNILEGMGELIMSLVWKNGTSQEWESWLQLTLQGAAKGGDAEMVLALLKAGAPSSVLSFDGLTPLHSAVLGGSLDVVSSLLKTRAIRDVNKKTLATGETPLYVAVKNGHTDVALALVRAGGDVNVADYLGWSPLMRAVFDGRTELVTDLLLWGSQVNAKDKEGYQALHNAVRQGHLSVIKVLLRARACPSTRGEDEMSPVDLAIQGDNTEALFELLASVPNLNILDDSGNSAMSIAVVTGNAKAIGMLADAGMDLNSRISNENLPLHMACYYLRASSVQTILHRNADENVRDGDNDLPHNILGQGVPEGERDHAVIEDIRKMLARAPADRAWRRRGWLAMLKARERATDNERFPDPAPTDVRLTLDQQHRRKDHEDGAGNDQHDEVEPRSGLSSRRKLLDERKWATGDALHVHQTRKKFHWIVTTMVDMADELIFRNIVSYL